MFPFTHPGAKGFHLLKHLFFAADLRVLLIPLI